MSSSRRPTAQQPTDEPVGPAAPTCPEQLCLQDDEPVRNTANSLNDLALLDIVVMFCMVVGIGVFVWYSNDLSPMTMLSLALVAAFCFLIHRGVFAHVVRECSKQRLVVRGSPYSRVSHCVIMHHTLEGARKDRILWPEGTKLDQFYNCISDVMKPAEVDGDTCNSAESYENRILTSREYRRTQQLFIDHFLAPLCKVTSDEKKLLVEIWNECHHKTAAETTAAETAAEKKDGLLTKIFSIVGAVVALKMMWLPLGVFICRVAQMPVYLKLMVIPGLITAAMGIVFYISVPKGSVTPAVVQGAFSHVRSFFMNR